MHTNLAPPLSFIIRRKRYIVRLNILSIFRLLKYKYIGALHCQVCWENLQIASLYLYGESISTMTMIKLSSCSWKPLLYFGENLSHNYYGVLCVLLLYPDQCVTAVIAINTIEPINKYSLIVLANSLSSNWACPMPNNV